MMWRIGGSRRTASLAGGAFIATIAAVGLSATTTAWADDVECYASVSLDKVGEFTVSIMLAEGSGKQTSMTPSWTPERLENEGAESTHFSRPSLILDYTMDGSGAIDGPKTAEILTSRYSDSKSGDAPPMKELQLRAKGPTPDPLVWSYADQSRGQVMLAKLIKENKPQKLTIELLDKANKVLAGATFDLSHADMVQGKLAEAKAAADKRVAAYQALPTKGKTCPR